MYVSSIVKILLAVSLAKDVVFCFSAFQRVVLIQLLFYIPHSTVDFFYSCEGGW